MSWNHRVLAYEHKGEVYFEIHEVYYNGIGIPKCYTEKAITVGGDSVEGILWTLDRMKESLAKPILWGGDKFPEEFINN